MVVGVQVARVDLRVVAPHDAAHLADKRRVPVVLVEAALGGAPPFACSVRAGARAGAAMPGDASDEASADDARKRLELSHLERCLELANLESKAEEAEKAQDLCGAIEAYEALLAMQPPDSPSFVLVMASSGF